MEFALVWSTHVLVDLCWNLYEVNLGPIFLKVKKRTMKTTVSPITSLFNIWLMTLTLPKFVVWSVLVWYSQTADVVCLRCPFSLLSWVLVISPMECSSQLLHVMSYSPPVFFIGTSCLYDVPADSLRCWIVLWWLLVTSRLSWYVTTAQLLMGVPLGWSWWSPLS